MKEIIVKRFEWVILQAIYSQLMFFYLIYGKLGVREQTFDIIKSLFSYPQFSINKINNIYSQFYHFRSNFEFFISEVSEFLRLLNQISLFDSRTT